MESHLLDVGVDIGGTFTDVVAVRGTAVAAVKVLSTPDDLSRGVLAGIEAAAGRLGAGVGDVGRVVHATTAATNALLERRGARVGLIVTDGFRDILEIGRQRRFNPYDLARPKLAALVPRERVVQIGERLDARGEVVVPLDEAAVREALASLEAQGVEAVAVSFLHAYREPRHEQRALAIAAEAAADDDLMLFASHQVVPEAREFERTSTTVIAAYLAPVVARYLEALADRLAAAGAPRRYWVMKSSGGLFTADAARAHPEELVESGPAAGVIGAAAAAAGLGIRDIISFDMGGTTAKASLVRDATPRMNYDYEVGGAAHAGGFLHKGTGYPLRVPVIDLAEVGTGGGSIAWIDEGGALRVGPRSAGAMPGPVCYGRGGRDPTVTDADLVLGYLPRSGTADDLEDMDAAAAHAAIEEQIAGPLGLSVTAAARGIFDLANAHMADAVRLVSVARGIDPRELTLVAFGGAGPVHAWAVARELLIASVLVPPLPGVFSAVGLLGADFRLDAGRGVRIDLDDAGAHAALTGVYTMLDAGLRGQMRDEGHADGDIRFTWSADLRFVGQSYEINVIIPAASVADIAPALMLQRFREEHERLYGHASSTAAVEVITARASASVPGAPVDISAAHGADERRTGERDVSFDGTLLSTPVVSRGHVDAARSGPVAIEEADTTVIVPPGAQVTPAQDGFLRITLGGAGA